MKSKKKEGKIEKNYKYIKIPDWIYWGSDRVVLQYKNPEGEYMSSEFYPMDYEEVETKQAKQLNELVIEKEKQRQKMYEYFQEQIKHLMRTYPTDKEIKNTLKKFDNKFAIKNYTPIYHLLIPYKLREKWISFILGLLVVIVLLLLII